MLTAILSRTTQESVKVHGKSTQCESKEQSHEEQSSQLSSDLQLFHFIYFHFSLISQLGKQTISQGTSTFENLVRRAHIRRTRARI